MTRLLVGVFMVGAWFTMISTVLADDAKDAAIRQDRKQITGEWRIVALEVNGKKVADEDAKKVTVVNHPDGTWILRSENKELFRGNSSLDPMQKPKTIDFTPVTGDSQGKLHLGIYELGEKARRLCFAFPGKDRPADFTSTTGGERVLVTLERVKSE